MKKRKEERNMSENMTMGNALCIRSLKAEMGLLSLRSFALSLALVLVSVVILVSVIISRITA